VLSLDTAATRRAECPDVDGPGVRHVFVVMMENNNYSGGLLIPSTAARVSSELGGAYINNTLVPLGSFLMTNYHAGTHLTRTRTTRHRVRKHHGRSSKAGNANCITTRRAPRRTTA